VQAHLGVVEKRLAVVAGKQLTIGEIRGVEGCGVLGVGVLRFLILRGE